jgi:hypothetical protein
MTMKRKPQKLALLGVRSTKAKTGITVKDAEINLKIRAVISPFVI